MWLTEMTYKRWVVVAAVIFAVGIGMGVTISLAAPEGTSSQLVTGLAAIQGILTTLANLPPPLLAIIIFLNNAFTLVTNYLFSPIFCLFPILALTLNGCIVGFISPPVVSETSFPYLLALLLPHGVFEIPAFIMGEAAALSIGTSVMLVVFKKANRESLAPRLKESLKYLAIAIGLLVPAAIIEVLVTTKLLTQGG